MRPFLSLLLLLLIVGTFTVAAAKSSSRPTFTTRHSKMAAHLDHRRNHHAGERPSSPALILEETLGDNTNEDALVVDADEDEEEQYTPSAALSRGGATDASASDSFMESLLQRLKIGFYFGLWYALNVVYNIVNKKVLNALPAPLIVGSIQFGVGALYVAVLWAFGLRAKPKLNGPKGRLAVRTVGFWHCVGQLASMVSLGAGPVSFTHIVKALEPFFSALVAALYFGKWMHPVVYATLIPVVGGVGYACLKEKSFSWLAFGAAMGSNLAFALRAVLSKMSMTSETGENPIGTNISAPNLFGLVTCAAFWISIPMALAAEGQSFFQSAGMAADPETLQSVALPSLWQSAVQSSEKGALGLIQGIVLSGAFHYLNNEVMYLALSNVHPVTLAVGNTMKRVFIMVASVMVFRNHISLQAGIGSAVGISGVLLYSLTKQYYENLEKEQNAKKAAGLKAKVTTAKAKAKTARKQLSRK